MIRLRKKINFNFNIQSYILKENQVLHIGLIPSFADTYFYTIKYIGDRNKSAKINIKYTGNNDVYYLGNNLYEEVMFGVSSKLKKEKVICALFIRYADVEKPPKLKVHPCKVVDLKVIYDAETHLPIYAINRYNQRVELTDEIINQRHIAIKNRYGHYTKVTSIYYENKQKKRIFKRLKKN